MVPSEFQGQPHEATGPVAIVVARYNETITRNLLQGAVTTLTAQGIEGASDHRGLGPWRRGKCPLSPVDWPTRAVIAP